MNASRAAVLTVIAMVLLMGLVACSSQPETSEDAMAGEPEWHKGQTLYEAYVRAYSEEGTFARMTADLDRIADLGVTTVWLMPVQPIGEEGRKGSAGSPYSVRDYFAVGKEYGSIDDMKEFVDTAHAKGLKVILDVVMNHSANDYPLMDDKPDMWMRDEDGNFTREVADWSDVTDWNHDNPETRQYLTDALLFWVNEVDVDGFRCDVAGMVPPEFWTPAIKAVREAKPDAFMLAEWEEPWVLDTGFDAAYDWKLYHNLKEHRHGGIDTDSLWSVVEEKHTLYPVGSQPMRFIENHDEPRAADEFGWPELKPYAALIFTLPGVPLIYSGQEIGETHKPSLFEPEPIDWAGGDDEINDLYTALVQLRNSSEALREGSTARLALNEPGVLAFTRIHGNERALVLINFSEDAVTVDRPISVGGGDFTDPDTGESLGVTVTIPAHGYRVFILS